LGLSRHTAAGVLFELLVLKTQDYIHVEQSEPFGDICISSTDKMFASAP
jgi:chromatin segregation and condensation protein Rec8/ScpA/Scc1 (kleisin family)